MNSLVLVWLQWPEECFRAGDGDIVYLASLVPEASVVAVSSEEDFLRRLPEATHVVVWSFKAEWYALAGRMKVLATPAAGRELVAWRSAPPGVTVHFGGFHGEIMAESVAAFCLAWARGFFRRPPETGIWPRQWLGGSCYTLAGTRAVVAGYGRIGRAVGAKLTALGVEVLGFGRSNIADLPRAAESADWFVMALPSDTGTDDFLDSSLIARLPPRCVVVNVGRGNAVDESALRSALASGRIAGAYLDVFKNEPTCLSAGSAARGASAATGDGDPIWAGGCPNLVAMPHSAAFSPDYIKRAFKELKDEGLL